MTNAYDNLMASLYPTTQGNGAGLVNYGYPGIVSAMDAGQDFWHALVENKWGCLATNLLKQLEVELRRPDLDAQGEGRLRMEFLIALIQNAAPREDNYEVVQRWRMGYPNFASCRIKLSDASVVYLEGFEGGVIAQAWLMMNDMGGGNQGRSGTGRAQHEMVIRGDRDLIRAFWHNPNEEQSPERPGFLNLIMRDGVKQVLSLLNGESVEGQDEQPEAPVEPEAEPQEEKPVTGVRAATRAASKK